MNEEQKSDRQTSARRPPQFILGGPSVVNCRRIVDDHFIISGELERRLTMRGIPQSVRSFRRR